MPPLAPPQKNCKIARVSKADYRRGALIAEDAGGARISSAKLVFDSVRDRSGQLPTLRYGIVLTLKTGRRALAVAADGGPLAMASLGDIRAPLPVSLS
jgi:hypothetical protein